MHYKALQKSIDLIEERLTEDLSLSELAQLAGYSLYHFVRAFGSAVGCGPIEYMQRRRLTEAASVLMKSDRQIIDIAFDYQFNSPETFSRAFRRMFGILPSQCRKERFLHNRFLRQKISMEQIIFQAQDRPSEPIMVDLEELTISGIAQFISVKREGIIETWDRMLKIEHQAPEVFIGASLYSIDREVYGAVYLAGKRRVSPDTDDPLYVTKTFPRSRYARFIHKGPYSRVSLTYDYIFQTWLPQKELILTYPFEIESLSASTIVSGFENDTFSCEILIPVSERLSAKTNE